MKILLVEDDYLQAVALRESLHTRWSDATLALISTESEFRSALDWLLVEPPDLVFIDMMLRWQNTSSENLTPPDSSVAHDGPYRAGLRCLRLLLQYPETRNVPILVHTVLDRSDLAEELCRLPQNVQFIQKTANTRQLVDFAGSLLATRQELGVPNPEHRDVFICHASEDRPSIVDPLIAALEEAGISIWHDRAEIQWGDSLLSRIQYGMSRSRYVLAVLSPNSLAKRWPLAELNAALAGEISAGVIKLLPLLVGTDVEKAAILRQLPFQQDKLYEVWTGSPAPIVEKLRKRLRQQAGA